MSKYAALLRDGAQRNLFSHHWIRIWIISHIFFSHLLSAGAENPHILQRLDGVNIIIISYRRLLGNDQIVYVQTTQLHNELYSLYIVHICYLFHTSISVCVCKCSREMFMRRFILCECCVNTVLFYARISFIEDVMANETTNISIVTIRNFNENLPEQIWYEQVHADIDKYKAQHTHTPTLTHFPISSEDFHSHDVVTGTFIPVSCFCFLLGKCWIALCTNHLLFWP